MPDDTFSQPLAAIRAYTEALQQQIAAVPTPQQEGLGQTLQKLQAAIDALPAQQSGQKPIESPTAPPTPTPEQRLAFLLRVGAALAAALDVETLLETVAHLAVPTLADWCVVDVVEAGGPPHLAAAAHADPAKAPLLETLRQRYPPGRSRAGPVAHVRTGQPVLVADAPDAALAAIAQNEEHRALLQALGVAAVIVVPLRAREQTLGLLLLARGAPGQRFNTDDLALAAEFARRAALAIDNLRLHREMQEMIRAREAFLAIASHELKTPLTGIIGYAYVLQQRATHEQPLTERDRMAISMIVEQSERLNRLIGKLLDASRIEAGQLDLERGRVDLGALVRRVVESLQPTLERHSIQLACPAEPVVVEGDDLRLEQVVHNLLLNAIKYSPAGGPIAVQVERRADQIAISVSDQGIGIPSDALDRIFQRFYRAPNADASNSSGMGVGLYVVKEIVALHGGTIEVASTEGQGSTFTIWLPIPPAGAGGWSESGG